MQSVLEFSLNMKNSKSETAIKKNFVLKSRIVKALLPYYVMGVVFIGAIEYAWFSFLWFISPSTVFNLFCFALIQIRNY